MRNRIKFFIGIVTAMVGTQCLLFWLDATGGKLIWLGFTWVILYGISLFLIATSESDDGLNDNYKSNKLK